MTLPGSALRRQSEIMTIVPSGATTTKQIMRFFLLLGIGRSLHQQPEEVKAPASGSQGTQCVVDLLQVVNIPDADQQVTLTQPGHQHPVFRQVQLLNA